ASLASGSATLVISSLPAANHSITVSYSGNANFGGSTSAVLTQSVNKSSTSTALASSLNPSVFGQTVTFTVTVSAVAPGAGTPTGTVTFLDGTVTLGTSSLTGGTASFATSALSAVKHTITVSYAGDSNFSSSTSATLKEVVNQASTSATVNSSLNPSVFGQSVTFTATVAAVSPGAGTPTGTVTFLDGQTTLGTTSLTGGTATLVISTLA